MSLPAIGASGLDLLASAEQRLSESARTLTRAAASTDDASPAASPDADSSGGDDVVAAAVGVIYGRTAFETGLRLIAVGRDTEKSLVDLIA